MKYATHVVRLPGFDGINITHYINSLNYSALAFDWMD
jgi:hypothetical protein